jgi:hypothetical protein
MDHAVSAALTQAMGGEGLRVGDPDDFTGRFAATMNARHQRKATVIE